MLAKLGCLLLVTTILSPAASHPYQDQNSEGALDYKLLENRLDQLELKLQNSTDQIRFEQNSLLNNTNALLEKILNSLNVIQQQTRQITVINSCKEATTTGKYHLQLANRSAPTTVFCDMELLDGGWLVIQQRLDDSVNFNRSWADYRYGFGVVGPASEFWLGLETIHQLTSGGDQELLVQLRNESGHDGYARYGRFKVEGDERAYKVSSLNGFDGTIRDVLSYVEGHKFSTFDKDNDQWYGGSCAQKYGSGWWFDGCGSTKLNGPFKKNVNTEQGISWSGWTSEGTYSRMLIRRK